MSTSTSSRIRSMAPLMIRMFILTYVHLFHLGCESFVHFGSTEVRLRHDDQREGRRNPKSSAGSFSTPLFSAKERRRELFGGIASVFFGNEVRRRDYLKWAAFGTSLVRLPVEKSAASSPATKFWTGTKLPLLGPKEALLVYGRNDENFVFPMARWPDPVLRVPSRPSSSYFVSSSNVESDGDGGAATATSEFTASANSVLRDVAEALRRTCRTHGAVGLAAQQCGIGVSMVYLDLASPTTRGGIQQERWFLDPRIVERSPETQTVAWTERCLVLPDEVEATVLRDAWVRVRAEDPLRDGKTFETVLKGEAARAMQHECDHDRGILLTDHMGLDEIMPWWGSSMGDSITNGKGGNDGAVMRRIETPGHAERQQLAYDRYIGTPSSSSVALPSDSSVTAMTTETRPAFPRTLLPEAWAAEEETSYVCDEACKERLRQRRAMFQQSRTTTKRQDMFDLSQQRAALYNTTYQGASCPTGIPCY